jgi:hypothetical protein
MKKIIRMELKCASLGDGEISKRTMIRLQARKRLIMHAIIRIASIVNFSRCTEAVRTTLNVRQQLAGDGNSKRERSNRDTFTVSSTNTVNDRSRNQRKQKRTQQKRLKLQQTIMDFDTQQQLPSGDSRNSEPKRRVLKDSKKKQKGGKGGPFYDDDYYFTDLCIVRDSIIVQQRSVDGSTRKRELVKVSFTTKSNQLHNQQRMTTMVDVYENKVMETTTSLISPTALSTTALGIKQTGHLIVSSDKSTLESRNSVRQLQQTYYPPPPEWAMPYPYCDEVVPVPAPTAAGEIPTADVPPPLPTEPVPTAAGEIPTAEIPPPPPGPNNSFPDTNPVQPSSPSGENALPPSPQTNDGGGGIPFMPTMSPYLNMSPESASFVDCDAIASGTAPVNGYYYEEFLITMKTGETTNISSVKIDLQQHLQKYVATSMVGCRDLQDSPIPPPAVLRQSNTTLRNVVFYISKNRQRNSSVSTKQSKYSAYDSIGLVNATRKYQLGSFIVPISFPFCFRQQLNIFHNKHNSRVVLHDDTRC